MHDDLDLTSIEPAQLAADLGALARSVVTTDEMAQAVVLIERALALPAIDTSDTFRCYLTDTMAELWPRYAQSCAWVLDMCDAVHNDDDGAQ